jgi:hypothetical protein
MNNDQLHPSSVMIGRGCEASAPRRFGFAGKADAWTIHSSVDSMMADRFHSSSRKNRRKKPKARKEEKGPHSHPPRTTRKPTQSGQKRRQLGGWAILYVANTAAMVATTMDT